MFNKRGKYDWLFSLVRSWCYFNLDDELDDYDFYLKDEYEMSDEPICEVQEKIEDIFLENLNFLKALFYKLINNEIR